MTENQSPNVDDEKENSRSAGLLFPGQTVGRTFVWYKCQDATCGYGERARSDGSLLNEFCPRDGSLLVREPPCDETS
jgi:hypothetical protein